MYSTKFRQCATPTNAGINLFFDDFPVRDFFSNNLKAHGTWPAANVKENKENYFIELAAPGLSKEDFKVKLEADTLTISTEKSNEAKEENERYTRKEFRYNRFSRSFILPETVNSEDIRASYKNGVLQLTLPKKIVTEKEVTRTIAIS
ncbi:MAG: Hsp20/alpha crystallin family protein [Flavobacteriales bacterium]